VEANRAVGAEGGGGQHDDGGNPADPGDVAQDRRGARTHPGREIRPYPDTRLRRPALGAVMAGIPDLASALATERHLSAFNYNVR